jgi:hypothetical protein
LYWTTNSFSVTSHVPSATGITTVTDVDPFAVCVLSGQTTVSETVGVVGQVAVTCMVPAPMKV